MISEITGAATAVQGTTAAKAAAAKAAISLPPDKPAEGRGDMVGKGVRANRTSKYATGRGGAAKRDEKHGQATL
jgi:hypothetical protein